MLFHYADLHAPSLCRLLTTTTFILSWSSGKFFYYATFVDNYFVVSACSFTMQTCMLAPSLCRLLTTTINISVLLVRSFFRKGLLKRPKKTYFPEEEYQKRPFSHKRRPKLTLTYPCMDLQSFVVL